MAKKTIRDLFVKLNNFFTDFYIINNYYIIPATKSDESTKGYYYCILNSEMFELCRDVFPSDSIVYIDSVREAKDNMDLIKIVTDKNEKTKIIDKLFNYKNNFEVNCENIEWNDLNLSIEQIDAVFNNAESILLELGDKNNMTNIVISKSMFPLLTEKTLNNLFYAYINSYKGNNELHQLLFEFHYDYFQLNMRYLFIPLE